MAPAPTISLRLPQDVREKLDRLAERLHRSRSYVMQRALELHYEDIARESGPPKRQGRYANLLTMEGAAIGSDGPRTKQEIDDYIRWLRDDDRIPG